MSSESSWRCSGVIDSSIRCIAAAWRARLSSSCSTDSGLSGKNSPCLSMKSAKSCVGVLAARVLLQQRVEVGHHVLERLPRLASRPGPAAPASCRGTAGRAPRGCSMSLSSSYAARASGDRQSYSDSSRTAREVCGGSASSCASRNRASSDGSGNSACFSCLERAGRAARAACSSMPSMRPDRSSERRRCCTRAQQVVETAQAVGTALHEVAYGVAHAGTVEHPLAELVDRAARVVRRGQRIGAVVVRAVAVAAHRAHPCPTVGA